MWQNPQETAELLIFTEEISLMENFVFFVQWILDKSLLFVWIIAYCVSKAIESIIFSKKHDQNDFYQSKIFIKCSFILSKQFPELGCLLILTFSARYSQCHNSKERILEGIVTFILL